MTTKRKVSWLTGLILLIVATAAAQTVRSQTTPPSAAAAVERPSSLGFHPNFKGAVDLGVAREVFGDGGG
jgi:hypothetical protein